MDIVTLLLDRGADADTKDVFGKTALHVAAENGRASVVTALLERGADCNAKEDINGFTPLMLAAQSDVSVVEVLLEHGADVGATDEQGRTALHLVVNFFDGAQPFPADQMFYGRWRLACTLLLLQAGATITSQFNGQALNSLASHAASRRCRELVFALLWRGVHVTAPEDSTSDNEDDASDDGDAETALADKLAVDNMLADWPSGRLRAWRSETHALFPAAFRADVQALLLATLGSLDAAAAVDETTHAHHRAAPMQNPLRMLHERDLLHAIFQPLLLAHMGGPPAPPLA